MKFRIQIFNLDDTPLEDGELWFAEPHENLEEPKIRVPITKGVAIFDAQPGPLWGVFVDKQPILATAAMVEGDELVDLGEVVLIPQGVDLPAFHARDARVFGLPRSLIPPAPPGEEPLTKEGMSFAQALGSTAKQLGDASKLADAFALVGASVRLKGLPTQSHSALGLDFPSPELAKTALSLSELAFSLRPKLQSELPPPPPAGPQVLSVVGYSRELALRKLGAASYLTEVAGEVVDNPEDVGRVVRQLPVPGTELPAGSVVRIFIGKGQGES